MISNKRWILFRRRVRTRSTSGSAAIEFAFVAPVFFMFLFGIIEGGIMFFGQAALQNAVQNSSRLIRTGQAQSSAMTQAQFFNQVCSGISVLLNCANLQVDVESYSSGFSSSLSSPTDSSGNLKAGLNNYSTGNPCDVVVVRGFYKYVILTPGITAFLANHSGNNFNYLSAAAAFRNEPFTSAVSGC